MKPKLMKIISELTSEDCHYIMCWWFAQIRINWILKNKLVNVSMKKVKAQYFAKDGRHKDPLIYNILRNSKKLTYSSRFYTDGRLFENFSYKPRFKTFDAARFTR